MPPTNSLQSNLESVIFPKISIIIFIINNKAFMPSLIELSRLEYFSFLFLFSFFSLDFFVFFLFLEIKSFLFSELFSLCGNYSVSCNINKTDESKIMFNWAHYTIHSLDDYSLNELETIQRKNENENEEYQEKEGYINYVVEKKPTALYICLGIFAAIVIAIIVCILRYTKCKKPVRTYVRISDNNYLTEDNLYRY